MEDLSVDDNTASRSIVVSSLPSGVDESEIVMHFQSRKHGGGDIDNVVLLGNGSALVTFNNDTFVSRVQEKQHRIQGAMLTVQPCPYMQVFSSVLAKINPDTINASIQDTRAMVARLQREQNVKCTERGDATFMISGSFEQIIKCHGYICDVLSHRSHENKRGSHNREAISHSQDSQPDQKGKFSIQNDSRSGAREIEEGKNRLFTERKQELNESEKPSAQIPKESRQRRSGNDGIANGEVTERNEAHRASDETEKRPSAQKPKERCQRNSTSSSERKDVSKKSESKTSAQIHKESYLRNTRENSQETLSDGKIKSTNSEDVNRFKEIKVSEKEWYVYTRVNEHHLKKLNEKYAVEIVKQSCTVLIKPLKECSDDMLKKVAKNLSDMYDKAIINMECVRFALDDESNEQVLRKTVVDIKKTFPVFLERASDRQSWEVFGERKTVEEILQVLESKVKIRKVDAKSEDNSNQANAADDEDDLDDDVTVTAIEDDSDDNADADAAADDNDDIPSNLEHDLGHVKLSIYKGDITDETSDAIVNAANQSLSHDAGVAKAIVSRGGSYIQDESTRIVAGKGKLRTGDAAITASGRLSCKMVIHAVGPIWNTRDKDNCKTLLKKAMFSSLQQAEKYGYKSIAFPAISSGIYGMPKHVCANVMFDAIEEYNNVIPASRDLKVSDVRFVNNDTKTVNVFQREFRKRYGQGEIKKAPEIKKSTSSILEVNKKKIDDLEDLEPNILKQLQTEIPLAWMTENSDNQLNGHTFYRRGKFFYDDATQVLASLQLQDHQNSRESRRLQPSRSNSVKIIRKTSPFQSTTDSVQHYQEQTQLRSGTGSTSMHSDGHGGARPKSKPASQSNGHTRIHHEGKHSLSSKKRSQEDQDANKCPICLARLVNPKTLPKCRHTFCTSCLDNALKKAKKCPLCRDPLSTGHIGNQPDGSMVHRVEQFGLPGYDQYGTIVIQYSFDGGVQGADHPNPGQWYNSTCRTAYLPDNKNGQEVLKLLKKAFDCRLVFIIGRSVTSGMDNQIVWGDIPHKSSREGGTQNFGYPDPTYLSEVQQILKAMLSQ